MGKVIKLFKVPLQLEDKYSFEIDSESDIDGLYIRIKDKGYDISFDVGLNLTFLEICSLIGLPVYLNLIQALFECDEQAAEVVHQAYLDFNFLADDGVPKSGKDLVSQYINLRLLVGYPKDKKEFMEALELERIIFQASGLDVSGFTESLYFRANHY